MTASFDTRTVNNIARALDMAAHGEAGLRFWSNDLTSSTTLFYRDLRKRARAMARRLREMDVRPGDRVGLVAETSPAFVTAFFACQYAGAVACPLPVFSFFGSRDMQIRRVEALARNAGMAMIAGDDGIVPFLAEAVDALPARAIGYAVLTAGEAQEADDLPAPNATAYIQYSSGSMAEPKGVVITQQAVCANVEAIMREGLRVTGDDRCCSWLPLHHDMGLLGFLIAPVFAGVDVHYLTPQAFARRPTAWLELISRTQATISFAPSFAYDLAARRADAIAAALDLSSWRIAGVGGDMINAATLQRFAEAFAGQGFGAERFQPSYGMAEAVLAVSFAEPGCGVRQGSAQGDMRSFVSCGQPLSCVNIRVASPDGTALADGEEGQIWLRGSSISGEYYGDAVNTEAVRRPDGFMTTGDLGFLSNGEIFVTGREKALIKINGRSVWPQDVEWVACDLLGLATTDVVAFGARSNDTAEIVLYVRRARVKQDIDEAHVLLRGAINSAIGVPVRILFVPSRLLPRTSSGKIARAEVERLHAHSGASATPDDGPQ